MTAKPRLVLLTPKWFRADEEGLVQSSIARTMAAFAEVHVITLDGEREGTYPCGGVTLHDLGPKPLDPARELMVSAFEETARQASRPLRIPERAAAYLALHDNPAWQSAQWIIQDLKPQVIVLGSITDVPSIEMATLSSATRIVALPLLQPQLIDSDILPTRWLGAIDAIITVTESETDTLKRLLANKPGKWPELFEGGFVFAKTHPVIDPSVAFELPRFEDDKPHTVLVATDPYPGTWSHGTPRRGGPTATSAMERALRATRALPELPLVVVGAGTITTWHHGVAQSMIDLGGRAHLDAIVASALACVDIEPGPIVGRIGLSALTNGVPLLASAHSTSAKWLQESQGGVTYQTETELHNLIEALDEMGYGQQRELLAQAGELWATKRFGTLSNSVAKLARATGLA